MGPDCRAVMFYFYSATTERVDIVAKFETKDALRDPEDMANIWVICSEADE